MALPATDRTCSVPGHAILRLFGELSERDRLELLTYLWRMALTAVFSEPDATLHNLAYPLRDRYAPCSQTEDPERAELFSMLGSYGVGFWFLGQYDQGLIKRRLANSPVHQLRFDELKAEIAQAKRLFLSVDNPLLFP